MTATTTAPAADPRAAAFARPDGPEVFGGVVHGNQVWTPDPFDVETVHPEARAAFARLLARASSAEPPPHGKTLLLLGEAGSGKTHLLRAFRTAAHAAGTAYCGYLQMTSRSANYARYVLSYLIDSLEQPYRPGAATTGLGRLARGLIDALDMIPAADRQRLCDDLLEPAEVAELVFRFADAAVQYPQFAGLDPNLLRAVLFLLPNDGRIRPKALSWLRCEDLPDHDRRMLGGLVPRPGDEMPLRTIVGLGRLMAAVQSAALVLLVDQIEEVIELARRDAAPGELFRTAVNTLVDVADALPTAVVVVGCLKELFDEIGRQSLPRPKLDRLEHDPAPLPLASRRTAEDAAAIVAPRLAALWDAAGVPPDPANPVAPYTAAHLAPLAGMSARAVLAFFHQHRSRCVEAGRWVEPAGATPPPPPPPPSDFDQLWNDALAAQKPPLVDEPKLAELLAWAVAEASAEADGGVFFGAEADDRFVQVEAHAGNAVDKQLAAVCDKSAKGGGLGKQVEEVVSRAGEIPAVFLRSTDFPKTPGAEVTKRLAKLCLPVGRHRRHVVANSDWRLMSAFRTFAAAHGKAPGFADWQLAAKPLTGLPSLRSLLALDTRPAAPPPAPVAPPAVLPKEAARAAPPPATPAAIRLGQTRGAAPAAVEFDPQSLCRHAAFLGGSGSGKTTAALTVVEQLLLSGVPVVLVDRKGDLARYADPDAWIAPEPDADRAARRARLRAAIDVALYTPGKDAGRPLAIPVAPPDLGRLPAADREQLAQYAAAALGVMLGYKSRGSDPKLVILQKAIETLAAAPDRVVTIKALQLLVGDQDDALTSHFDGQYEAKHFTKLSQDLLTLGLQHRRLLEGSDRLDVDALLGRGAAARPGKTRLSVVSTQFLGDEQAADFWVSQLLLAVERWTRQHPSPRLQAVFLFDEADRYLPAVGKPATKGPMESLLRRARSAGVGVFLATQSPGDLDYKCRDQVTTWLVGKVKETVAVGKLRPVLEAKPGAADRLAEQGAGEFYLAREGDVRPVRADVCLIPPAQLSEDRILAVARLGGAAGG
ncbi:helicase HerA domain-containing protein [Urbifossiella limnaea]|uniref:AAA-like domain protein n=1 Tax=Urbifossiella limnaea TaxID=2528023 RepID=A0A517Y3F3_9BACT|nr:DUF87 domain-containing protein [Urbifossiella limnaea]QDU24248.1 AAA-like domain protein [Urbifossiella limnaea]